MRPTSKVEALRVQLMDAQRAQQTAEIALAKAREANIAEGIRAMIDSAFRERMDAQHERDCMRNALDKAQRTVQYLEQQVARLLGENQSPGLSSQLSRNSCLRYSPFAADYARHSRHRPARPPCSPAMSTISPLNSALSPSPTVKAESDDGKHKSFVPHNADIILYLHQVVSTSLLLNRCTPHTSTVDPNGAQATFR